MSNAREERGLIIAAKQKIVQSKRDPNVYIVPSQNVTSTKYMVNVKAQTCSCLDFESRAQKCKHLFAAEFSIQREVDPTGTVTEIETLTLTKRTTYKQDW